MKHRTGSKQHMTPLDRGLACAARREGKAIHIIAEALHRDPRTLGALFARRGLVKRREIKTCQR